MGSINLSALSSPAQIIPVEAPTRTLPTSLPGTADSTGFLNLIESLIGGEITPPQPTQLETGPAKPPVLGRREKGGSKTNDAKSGTDKKDRKNPRDSQQQDAPTMTTTTLPANSVQVRPRIFLMAMPISLPVGDPPSDQYVATQPESPNRFDETNPIALPRQTAALVNAIPDTAPKPQGPTNQVRSPKHSLPSQPESRHEEQPPEISAAPAPAAVTVPVVASPVVPVAVPVAAPVPIPVRDALPAPAHGPAKSATPVRQIEQKSSEAPKSLTAPPRNSTGEKVRQPEPVSFQARLTEREVDEPRQQPQPQETETPPTGQDPPQPAAVAAPALDETNPMPSVQARPEQIGYVPQKAPPAAEPAQKSKPAATDASHDVPQPEIKTLPAPNGAIPISSAPLRPASISEPKQTPSAAPPPSASTPADVPKPAAAPGSIREISVRIPAQDNSRGVEVQLIERGGKIEVTVRAGDQQLSSALKGDLTDLVRMLDSKGYKTETWTPSDTNPLVHGASHGIAEMTRSDTPQDRSGGQQQDSAGGGNSGSNSQQQRRQQQNRPAWLQELERRLGDA